jgi:hypothetical protein
MLAAMLPPLPFAPVPISRDWFDYTSFGVGLSGLLLTLWAVWEARGAKEAARQAEIGVLRHDAESDFGHLTQKAKELHGHVENDRLVEARLRTSDIRSELAVAVTRHKALLGITATDLAARQVDLKLMTDGLNPELGALSHVERVRLLGITGAILELFAGQWGQLRSRAEKGASNG